MDAIFVVMGRTRNAHLALLVMAVFLCLAPHCSADLPSLIPFLGQVCKCQCVLTVSVILCTILGFPPRLEGLWTRLSLTKQQWYWRYQQCSIYPMQIV